MPIVNELVTLLRYQADNTGLNRFNAGMAGVATRARGVMGYMRSIGTATKQGLVEGIREGVVQHRALNNVQAQAVRNTQRMGAGYSALGGYIKFALGAFSIKTILGQIDAWGQMEARMKAVTTSASEYLEVDKDIARISRLTYKSYQDNAELFVRTRRTMADLGKTTQDTVDVTEALSLGMVLSSTAAANSDNVITQFSKAIMNGKLQMEQYQSLMSQAPRLQTALADGLGVTTNKLLAMVKAGEITTEKMLPALQSQLAKMRIEAEEMPVTMADAFTVLNNASQRFFGQTLTKGRWVVLRITKSIEYLADNIDTVVGLLGSGAIVMGLQAARGASLALLAPWLRIAAAAAGFYLIAEDISVWANGGTSVFGRMFGAFDEWSTTIEYIQGMLKSLQALIGDNSDSLTTFLMKWGTILLVGYTILRMVLGIGRVLMWLAGPIRFVISLLLLITTSMWSLVTATLAVGKGMLTWPLIRVVGWLVAAALALKWMYENADKVTEVFQKGWSALVGNMEADIKRLTDKLAAMVPDWIKDALRNATGGAGTAGQKKNDPTSGFGGSMFDPLNNAINKRLGNATQQPQSYNGGQNNNVTNDITINAQTNSPAALATLTANAAGSATTRSLNRGALRSTPNVEVSA